MGKLQKKMLKNNRDPTERHIIWRGFVFMFIRAGVLSYLFYRNLRWTAISAFVAGVCGVFMEKKRSYRRWQMQMGLEFREGLQGIAAALNAGYSIENAFAEARKDLELLYGKQSVLAPEFQTIIARNQLNCPVEQTLMELAVRSGLEDIRRFAEIFQTAKRTGGDFIAITRMAADRISEKIEVKREIETMISGKKMEAQIMNAVPLGMIVYFWICSPAFLECLYHGSGRSIMSLLLGIYLAAYYWSERIIQINI